MPVENDPDTSCTHATAVPKRSSTELRRAFIDARQRNETVADTLTSLGIGQSTYYKWKALWQEHGDAWLKGVAVTKAKRLPGCSVKETHDAIVELSLLHPNFGVKKLTKHLANEVGFYITATTIHGILKSNGVSTRQERAARLHQRYLAKMELTTEQRRLVRTIDSFADSSHVQEKEPGRVLIQDFIHMHYSAPLNRCTLHIVVDAHDQRAFAMFPKNESKRSAADCLELALTRTKKSGCKVKEVITPSRHKFLGSPSGKMYKTLLSRVGIRHRLYESTNNRRNSLVAEVWSSLREYLFQDLRKKCEENRDLPSALNHKIQDFLDAKFGDGRSR